LIEAAGAAARTGSESITRDPQRSASLIWAQLEIEKHKGNLTYNRGSWREGDTLSKAKAAGVAVLVDPYQAGDRNAAIVQFPGGYIVEIHSLLSRKN
jgi:hypothetical protein